MLKDINSPDDFKNFSLENLDKLSQEIRNKIISTIVNNGGHLGSSLGAVELVVALHKVFDTPNDRIIFDVGHQAYAHKLLTGRYDKFESIRTKNGLSGFTNKFESKYDHFTAGHAGPSISISLGIKEALKHQKINQKVIAVIGDGSMSSGISLEGLNNAGNAKNDLIIILNDNQMSISENVGALSKWLSNAVTGPTYHSFRKSVKEFLNSKGRIGLKLLDLAHKIADGTHAAITPGILFDGMGFQYIGPIDGHNLEELIENLEALKDFNEPVLLHVITQKGKGYAPSENDPRKYHGISSIESKKIKGASWTSIFSDSLIKLAREYDNVVAITAAMPDGTGLNNFYKYFPERFYDVGIAEQHAVAFSAGLAAGGMKPFVAIYSTFLQRAYDQIFHDVVLQNQPVVFVIDRAGLVGEDGATHHGVFDLSYLRLFPNLVIMTPKDDLELSDMLYTAYHYNGPIAIRFPRGNVDVLHEKRECKKLKIASFTEEINLGDDFLILASGWLNTEAEKVIKRLKSDNIASGKLVNVRFIKPLDTKLLEKEFNKNSKKPIKIITIEENTIIGGMGSAIIEWASDNNYKNDILRIAIPDEFIEHGTQVELRKIVKLNEVDIYKKIKEFLVK
jgi:1-deoxy-D-xylulose-5-phosphate synthase